jgi:hypothetical protein
VKRVEVGPGTQDKFEDVEVFLTAFERAVEAHHVKPSQSAALLVSQLTRKAVHAYSAMGNEEMRDYSRVKKAIYRRYDINEETYRKT